MGGRANNHIRYCMIADIDFAIATNEGVVVVGGMIQSMESRWDDGTEENDGDVKESDVEGSGWRLDGVVGMQRY